MRELNYYIKSAITNSINEITGLTNKNNTPSNSNMTLAIFFIVLHALAIIVPSISQ